MTLFMVKFQPLRGSRRRVGLWSMVHTHSKVSLRGVDSATEYLLRPVRVRQEHRAGAPIVVPRDGAGSSGNDETAESAGGVGYALRSLQSRTTVRVRTVYDDCRRFDALVVCYSNAAGGYLCEVCPPGERAHFSDGFGVSTAVYAVVLDTPPTR